MVLSIHTVLACLGLTMIGGLLGWSLWRLARWLGFIPIKRKKRHLPRARTNEGVGSNQYPLLPKAKGTLSRQALYSARKHRD